jgi:peptidoglycan/LPS O-acetylase OafA/YrhL
VLQRNLGRIVLPIGLIGYAAVLLAYHYRVAPRAFFTLADTTSAMIFVWLVSAAAIGFEGPVRYWLEQKPLRYLGKISYGIYVYHFLLPLPVLAGLSYFGVSYRVPGLKNFVFSAIATVIVAALSWELFERRINGLKRHFEYVPERAPGSTKDALAQVGVHTAV